MIEASEIMKRVTRMVTPTTVVVVENVVEAFSTTYRPNLASPRFPPYLLFCSGPLILLILFS